MFSAITHCDTSGLIGLNGQLAYRSSEDFKEFKKQTLGNQTILIMGKNTYQECGNLPERSILALSSGGNLLNGKPTDKTVKNLSKTNYIIICGGSSVYERFLLDCESVVVHYSKQPIVTIRPKDKPSYFPLQLLNEVFRPTTVKDFETFVQIWYFKRDSF